MTFHRNLEFERWATRVSRARGGNYVSVQSCSAIIIYAAANYNTLLYRVYRNCSLKIHVDCKI